MSTPATDNKANSATATAAAASAATKTEKLRVALCQLLVTSDKASNIAGAAAAVRKAKKEFDAQLVVLPEIWNGPYATDSFGAYAEPIPADAKSIDPKVSPSTHMLSAVAKECDVVLVGGSISERESGTNKIYNTCVVVGRDGAFIGKHRKVHLFDIDIPGKMTFKESETLSAGESYTVVDTPFGVKLGVGICYDMRFAEYAMA